MGWLCYLPEAMAVIGLIGVAWFFIHLAGLIIHSARGTAQCPKCRGKMYKDGTEQYLFLLPVFFGDTYENAENFLLHNLKPIASLDDIPSGQRAVRAVIYRCSTCSKKQVDFTDFLLVRGSEDFRGRYFFSYEPFAGLLNEWKMKYGTGGTHEKSS